MTEPLAELALRTVTITEVMLLDGSKRLDYEYDDDDIELWDILGMLEATVIAIKADLQKQWAEADDD